MAYTNKITKLGEAAELNSVYDGCGYANAWEGYDLLWYYFKNDGEEKTWHVKMAFANCENIFVGDLHKVEDEDAFEFWLKPGETACAYLKRPDIY